MVQIPTGTERYRHGTEGYRHGTDTYLQDMVVSWLLEVEEKSACISVLMVAKSQVASAAPRTHGLSKDADYCSCAWHLQLRYLMIISNYKYISATDFVSTVMMKITYDILRKQMSIFIKDKLHIQFDTILTRSLHYLLLSTPAHLTLKK